MSTKCPKCHSDNPDTQRFCGECATPLQPSKKIPVTETIVTPKEELTRGTTLAGRYEIIEELGKGGMGNVYRVEDKKTNEELALKLIKPEIASDKKTLERFSNELKLAHKISHKNVCRMYHLGEEKGVHFITMEYVPGEDLKSMIRMTRQLTVGTAISIAKQVCDGLVEAHRLGVIHRDLKPSNIMIDKAGTVRIMDFGIARSLKTKGITGTGVMIGTPEYMSPEQVEGKEVDQHSDIYSLGIILYEILTGRIPFEGDTPFAIGLKHKSEEPENPRRLNSQIPEDLSRLILKCLEKDRENRYQSAEELCSELTRIEEGIPTTERVIPKRKPLTSREITVKFSLKKLFMPALAFVAIIAVIILAVFLIRKLPSGKPSLPTHKQLTFTGSAYNPAISPDGKFIAYINYEAPDKYKLMVQDLLSGQSLEIFNAESIRDLRWTPDGSEISIHTEQDSIPKMLNISRLGGPPREIESSALSAWSPNGTQIAGAWTGEKKIRILNKSTGDSSFFSLNGPIKFVWDIDWSPSGNLLLVLTHNENNRTVIWTMKTNGSNQYKVIEESDGLSSPRWSSQGDAIYYLRGKAQLNEIWKVPVSPESGKPTKSPYIVISGFNFGRNFTLSGDNKHLAYTRQLEYSNLILARIKGTGTERKVETKQLTTGTLWHESPSISPDGTQIAFAKGGGQKSNIYVMPIDGGSPKQITFLNSRNTNPVWSSDGRWIAFGSNEGGSNKVWKVSSQGGRPFQFAKSKLSISGGLVWHDESLILYQKEGNRNFIILNSETEEEKPLVEDESVGWIFSPNYSPDGKKIAVYWNRKPKRGIWIISLEDFSQKFLYEGYVDPIGWSTDSNCVKVYDIDTGKYLKIELDSGQVKELSVIPFTIEGKSLHKILNEKPEVFVDSKTLSDVWLVENFDPDIR